MGWSRRRKLLGVAALTLGIVVGVQRSRRRTRRLLLAAPDDAFRHERVTVNGVTLHCATAGEGSPVLMLHGFPEAWFLWEPLMEELPRRGFQAIAPDLRGYNLSDKPASVADYRLSALVEDVHGLLEAYSPGQKATLIGHDWGGIIAWAFAAAYPDALERLIILNAPHPNIFARELATNPAQQMASAYAPLLRSRWAEGALSAFDCLLLRKMVFGTARRGAFPPEMQARLRAAWAQRGALTGGLNYYRALDLGLPPNAKRASSLRRLAEAFGQTEMRVSVPTLVIWGEKDLALRPGCLDGLEAYVPTLTMERLPEAGHWVLQDEPRRVAALIGDFLAPSGAGEARTANVRVEDEERPADTRGENEEG